MATLFHLIDELVDNITVTDRQEDKIKASFNNLQEHLLDADNSLSIKEVFLNGSYARDTMIRPLADIDTFAVIDKDDYSESGQDPNTQTVLRKFKTYLEECVDYNNKVRQDRPCVTIDLSYIHIDVLPALRKFGCLYIPNESLDGWILTDPKGHTDKLNQVNRLRKYLVKKIVRVVKSWKSEKSIEIPSFHVEEVAISVFNCRDFVNLEEGIRYWFEFATAYLMPNRFKNYNTYCKVRDNINEVNSILTEAKELYDSGKELEAKQKWASVFDKFPKVYSEEAKSYSKALSSGSLRYSATTGLSMTTGKIMGASKGFYGEEK